jgi:hypothetical protein
MVPWYVYFCGGEHVTSRDFTRFLASHGLAAAGSTETIEDLRRRYGTRRWFGFQDVIDLPPASLFPEQTETFFILANRTCLLPPTEFECDFDYLRNGPRTHACALERLTALFGTPESGLAVNTLCETWTFERMSLRIRTFLPEKTGARSPLYDKYPQLWQFCRISIDCNWVRPMVEAEAGALQSLAPNQILPVDRAFRPDVEHPTMWERGLFRLAGESAIFQSQTPFLWKQGIHIGWSAGPWSAIFERGLCLSLTLEQVAPARGGGYSRLVLNLHNPFSLEREPVDTVLLAGQDMHTLDRVSPEVSQFWELPLITEESWND